MTQIGEGEPVISQSVQLFWHHLWV